ncbi:hypothetical protein Tco_0471707 [Tanacetum coccineum]
MCTNQQKLGEGSTNPTVPFTHPLLFKPINISTSKKQNLRKPKINNTQIPQSSGLTEHVADEAVYKELDNDDADMFGCEYLTVMRVLAEQEVATKDVNLTVDECARVQRFVLDKLNHCYNSNSKERIVIIEVRYNLQTITSIPHNMIRHKFKAKARENGLELEYALKEEISNQF